jgi:cytochrome P450
MTLYPLVLDIIGRVSTRVFIGPDLAENDEWLALSIEYSVLAFECVRQLRLWPAILRQYVHWMMPDLRRLRKLAAMLEILIKEEVERRSAREASDPAYEKPKDILQWIEEVSRGRPYSKVNAQLQLTFAAIHSTSDALTKVLLYIVECPGLIDELRQEMVTAFAPGFSKSALFSLRLMDSVLKESMRLSPSSIGRHFRI